jgi:hypothetical protein
MKFFKNLYCVLAEYSGCGERLWLGDVAVFEKRQALAPANL